MHKNGPHAFDKRACSPTCMQGMDNSSDEESSESDGDDDAAREEVSELAAATPSKDSDYARHVGRARQDLRKVMPKEKKLESQFQVSQVSQSLIQAPSADKISHMFRRVRLAMALQRRMLSAVLESSQEFVSPSETVVDYAVFGAQKRSTQEHQLTAERSQDAQHEHALSKSNLSDDNLGKLSNEIADERTNASSKSAEPDPNCARGCCIPQTSCGLM